MICNVAIPAVVAGPTDCPSKKPTRPPLAAAVLTTLTDDQNARETIVTLFEFEAAGIPSGIVTRSWNELKRFGEKRAKAVEQIAMCIGIFMASFG